MNIAPALHFIGGEWIDAPDAPLVSAFDPSTGEHSADHRAGTSALAGQAVATAREAFETTSWSKSPRQRAAALLELADRLDGRKEEIAQTMARENGKVLGECRHEVGAGVSELRYYAGLARNIFGRTAETTPDSFSILHREPIGVAAVITPWNAPITLLVRSLAPALAVGCSAVIKPATQTAHTHRLFMECVAETASITTGIVNSVNENGSLVGEALVRSEDVDVISFTGSSATGKKIMAAAAGTLKRLSLELGGKAPAVVFEDADLDRAAAALARAVTVHAGQMCMAATRVLVHESVHEALTERLVARLAAIKVGPASAPGIEMGPLIDRANQARALALVEQAADEGELLLRGEALVGQYADGAFITPSVFRTDDLCSPLVQEELFAPMVSVELFSTEREAVSMANASRYGLGASVWTNELQRGLRVSRAIKAGTVWLNAHAQMFAEIETGGYKQSGLGRLHGSEGLDDFLETKHVFIPAAL